LFLHRFGKDPTFITFSNSVTMNFDLPSLNALREVLMTEGHVVVSSHTRPDGDAIGSALALANMLRKSGKEVTVIMPDHFDRYLAWMPAAENILIGHDNRKTAKKIISGAAILFLLDYSAPDRAGVLEDSIVKAGGFKVMIDHHLHPADFTQLKFHSVAASSTSELVYDLFEDLGFAGKIDSNIAACLYVGIVTDTGSFRFSSTTPKVHRIAADLISKGIDAGDIQNKIFNNFSESRTRFLGFVLNHKLKVLPEYRTAYMTMSDAELNEFSIQHGDTEGFVNYCLTMEGINFGVLLKQGGDKIKLSFRSIGQFSCNEFAHNFGGGGHHNAAGGISWEPLEKTEEKFLNLLPQFKDKLDY